MTPSVAAVLAGIAAACSAAALVVVVGQVRAGNAERMLLTRELAGVRAELVQARAEADAAHIAVAPVNVAARPLDERDLDAIAARVAQVVQGQAKTEALVAAAAADPSPQQLAARAEAQRKVDGILAAGHERADDVVLLRHMLAEDPEGRAEVARQLAVAINTGKVTPADPRAALP
jgi:hypothetical protein